MKKIKIVCTIGPKTSNPDLIKLFKKNGMDILRLNSSHGKIEWIKKTIKNLRKCFSDIPIILDLPGSKIRIQNKNLIKNFKKGSSIIFTCGTNSYKNEKIVLNDKNIYKKVHKQSLVFADDGNLLFKIIKKKDKDMYCQTLEGGILKSGKGISFEKVETTTGKVSNNEKKILKFAKKLKPDFIGVSYTVSKSHITSIKKILNDEKISIIAKIENKQGVDNLPEILNIADAIMIDRGDLSLSASVENITLAQKKIINISNKFSKPVIVATDLLKSMIKSNVPTKSEIADITNAVHDGCSATMLSEETVFNKSSLSSIITMKKIINSATKYQELENKSFYKEKTIPDTTCLAAIEICKHLPITKIIIITKTGYAARKLSSFNLKPDILAVTNDKIAARSFNLIKGNEGIYLNIKFLQKSTDHIINSIKNLYKIKKITKKDLILITGVGYPKKGNKINLIQIHKVNDLAKTFRW